MFEITNEHKRIFLFARDQAFEGGGKPSEAYLAGLEAFLAAIEPAIRADQAHATIHAMVTQAWTQLALTTRPDRCTVTGTTWPAPVTTAPDGPPTIMETRCEICGTEVHPRRRTNDPDPRAPQVACVDAEACAWRCSYGNNPGGDE